MKTIHYFTAFLSGFITLSLEILGFRALAPHFGYSTYVFGTLIGLILFALALGYWIGGRLSRGGLKPKVFSFILLAATLYLATASAFYQQVIQAFANFDIIAGAFLATFALWAFPMAVLAAVSPYLVGLGSIKEHPGYSSGRISAAGTLGGLAGTFLTSFYLLPAFGTRSTFIGNVYAAAAMTLIWLFAYNRKWMPVALALPFIMHSSATAELPANVVHAEESAYSRLEVVDSGNILSLRTGSRSGTSYSAIAKDGSLPPFLLYDLFAVPVAARDSKRGLLLGVGAGTLPRIHGILNPDLSLIGVEIDPQVIAIADRFFGLADLKNLESVSVDDARPFLARDTSTYDLIEMDVFRETEIPFYLVSKEFFELTNSRLNENGLLLMNVYDPTSDRWIQDRITNTIASAYPYVYLVPVGLGSSLVAATKTPLIIPGPEGGAQDERLAGLTTYFKEHVQKVVFSGEAEVFTDDLAPIETLYIAPLKEISYN